MNSYHVKCKIELSYVHAASGAERVHVSECAAIVHAASAGEALGEAEPLLFEQAEANAGVPAGWIMDADIIPDSVTVAELTERDRLIALGRDIAPPLPGFEEAL